MDQNHLFISVHFSQTKKQSFIVSKSLKQLPSFVYDGVKMEYRITITLDEDEREKRERILRALDESGGAVELLGKRERYVLQALTEHRSGAARRVIHREAAGLEDSPFTNPDENGPERSEVGSILSSLQDMGLATREKSTWYPTDDAFVEPVEVESGD